MKFLTGQMKQMSPKNSFNTGGPMTCWTGPMTCWTGPMTCWTGPMTYLVRGPPHSNLGDDSQATIDRHGLDGSDRLLTDRTIDKQIHGLDGFKPIDFLTQEFSLGMVKSIGSLSNSSRKEKRSPSKVEGTV
ncbi:hypothetical protein TNCV_332851 [Trichonephila clavipes]|nr:hypothetical protein TNCV_332851 [Trichonephila clavipes]